MKILQIRFKNLNALYGEWQIDLREPIYQDSGIFAITGPTGSGKSTLLDAICLALYAETPRLGKITKSKNDIMSRQTGECYAEVLFETDKGQFISQFSQRRAKKQANGALQEPIHQLALASGTIIESKKNLVGKAIIETTGMDFTRFTRSMLLAQGGFDSFLKATDDDKSKILQQITASGLYSELSKQVFLAHKEAKLAYDSLLAQSQHLQVLDDENLAQLQEASEKNNQTLIEINKEIEQKKQERDWLVQQNSLIASIKELEITLEKTTAKKHAFLPKIEIITQAQKALSIEASYTSLTHYEGLLLLKKKELTQQSEKAPKLKAVLVEHNQKISTEQNLLEQTEQQYKQLLPILNEVKQLDIEIEQLDQQLKRLNSALVKELEKQQLLQKEHLKLENEKLSTLKQISDSKNFMDHGLGVQIKSLSHNFSSLFLQIERLKQLKLSQITLLKQQDDNISSQKNVANKLELLSKNLRAFEQEIVQIKNDEAELVKESQLLLNNRTIEEILKEKESLTKSLYYIDTVANLTAHRANLMKDEPCPLCGSIEHPYALEVDIDTDKKNTEAAIELLNRKIRQANIIKEQCAVFTKKVQDKNLVIHQTQLEEEKYIQTHQFLQQTATELEKQQNELTAEVLRLTVKIEELITPLQLSISSTPLDTLITKLETLIKTYERHSDILSKGESELNSLAIRESHITVSLNELQHYLAKNTEEITKLTEQLTAKQDKRRFLFSDNDPNVELIKQEENLIYIKKSLQDLVAEQQQLTEQLTINSTQIHTLQSDIISITGRCLEAEQKFSALLQEVGFKDKADFQFALSTKDSIDTLQHELKLLEDELFALNTLIKKSRDDLIALQTLTLTEDPLNSVLATLSHLEKQLESARQTQIEIHTVLKQDQQAREQLGSLKHSLEQSRNHLVSHEKLNLLIGSADGKKFRHFAQGITFEILVMHANQQLAKMNDRYLLIRDNSHPLALNVIDNYQAGEIRTINNLSGGESFIMSLALALGLSQMSSQKTRVDSLFLDEGFGTLDEEALDVALDALSSLQHENKLIGIISHVPQLKNRITTQILIDAGHGGRSKMVGPGCKHINDSFI